MQFKCQILGGGGQMHCPQLNYWETINGPSAPPPLSRPHGSAVIAYLSIFMKGTAFQRFTT